MHYILICGSTRKSAQSRKITHWLSDEIIKENDKNTTDIIDLYECDIPIWDEAAWNKESDLFAQIKPYQERVSKADAIIIISPEWHGMVPGGLKNFLLYISSEHAAHKPCLLVGVSSSAGGAYPIAELRMSGYKNNRMTYIPDHLIIRNVEDVMNDHNFENDDKYIKERALYSLNTLYVYSKALKEMRDNNNLLDKKYPFGM